MFNRLKVQLEYILRAETTFCIVSQLQLDRQIRLTLSSDASHVLSKINMQSK
jgi:hypothetical protein